MVSSARRLSTVLLILTALLASFVGFNGESTDVKVGMFGYVVMAGFIIMLINGTRRLEFSLVGEAISKDVFVGSIVGGLFIVINNLNSAFSIGAPNYFLSLGAAGIFIAGVLVAPIVEEFLFRGAIYPVLYNLFGKNNFVAIPLQAAIFAFFHYAVYGGLLGLSNAPALFIGAFVFATVAGLLVRNSPKLADITTLEAPIVAHAIFNFYLLNANGAFLAVAG